MDKNTKIDCKKVAALVGKYNRTRVLIKDGFSGSISLGRKVHAAINYKLILGDRVVFC